LGNTETMKKY